ncbi:hypothetical protein C8Q77DRAFT_1156967 [Trametes polyzona]|nr:hypothetical protein C8Q77DRAFT_1156967 [Trametes polyzona]
MPYMHMAQILAGLPRLKALFLNPDLRETAHEPWCDIGEQIDRRLALEARGVELVKLLQSEAGELFEYAALQHHRQLGGYWKVFYPDWNPESIYHNYWPHEVDSRAYVPPYTRID